MQADGVFLRFYIIELTGRLTVFFGNFAIKPLFDLLTVCVSPRESNTQIDCSHIFHRGISMKGESTNANCNRK